MTVATMFLLIFFFCVCVNKEKLPTFDTQFFGWHRSKCDLSLLAYLRLTQFSYTDIGSFPDDDTSSLATSMTILSVWSSDIIFTPTYTSSLMILWLEQDTQFFLGGYFAFSRYLWKNNSTNRCSTLSLARNNKNPKIAKNRLAQKFHDGDKMLCWF